MFGLYLRTFFSFDNRVLMEMNLNDICLRYAFRLSVTISILMCILIKLPIANCNVLFSVLFVATLILTFIAWYYIKIRLFIVEVCREADHNLNCIYDILCKHKNNLIIGNNILVKLVDSLTAHYRQIGQTEKLLASLRCKVILAMRSKHVAIAVDLLKNELLCLKMDNNTKLQAEIARAKVTIASASLQSGIYDPTEVNDFLESAKATFSNQGLLQELNAIKMLEESLKNKKQSM